MICYTASDSYTLIKMCLIKIKGLLLIQRLNWENEKASHRLTETMSKNISDKYLHLEYINNSYNSKIRHITKILKWAKYFKRYFIQKKNICTHIHIFIYMYACIYVCKYYVCTYTLLNTQHTHIWMDKKSTKRCSTSLTFREMQIKTTVR